MGFVIGLDLGDAYSAVAYMAQGAPRLVDLSGGYGKPSRSSDGLFIPDTGEFIFGEYAVPTGLDGETVFNRMMSKLGQNTYIAAGGKTYPLYEILGLYIKDLLSALYALDPTEELKFAAVCVNDTLLPEARAELTLALAQAGVPNDKTLLVSRTEAVLTEYLAQNKTDNACIVVLDYGQGALRGGVYEVKKIGEAVDLKCLSYQEDRKLSGEETDKRVSRFLETVCKEHTDTDYKAELPAFVKQNKELLFRPSAGAIKLYYNFCSPPFAHTVTNEAVKTLTAPIESELTDFLNKLTAPCAQIEINTVILTGGGFEAGFAYNTVEAFFRDAVIYGKTPKAYPALGAAVLADGSGFSFRSEAVFEISADYGFLAQTVDGERFVPLIEKGSGIGERSQHLRVFINKEHTGSICLGLYKRLYTGEITQLGELELNGLPIRPKAAGFYDFTLCFKDTQTIEVTVTDAGFGGIFERTGYVKEITIKDN